MRHFSGRRIVTWAALALFAFALAACGNRVNKELLAQAGNIPPSFDVTLIADKDNQFDYDGAPLTEEDLRSALRYRKEQNLPCSTVLVKRGEKERIKNEHIIALARVAYQLKLRAFMQAKDGTISELVAQAKTDENARPADAGK